MATRLVEFPCVVAGGVATQCVRELARVEACMRSSRGNLAARGVGLSRPCGAHRQLGLSRLASPWSSLPTPWLLLGV
eukprot:6204036-Pleurochrysis_carterae.AAC.9